LKYTQYRKIIYKEYYDKIITTKDSTQQYAALHQLFIARGTPGLRAIMEAREYTEKSYIDVINNYPLFWNSVRANTLKAGAFADSIAANVSKLKVLYPVLKPAKIYFTIGALRIGGTTMKDMVLIGSEIAMGDEHTVTSEFPPAFAGVKPYFKVIPSILLHLPMCMNMCIRSKKQPSAIICWHNAFMHY
jgi:hypothetical protein